MNPLLEFYLGGPDDRGRLLKEILAWPDYQLEQVHDYIQWVFPNVERSHFNLKAPVLDEETIAIWNKSVGLRNLICKSAERYLLFLYRNTDVWCNFMDHNHLRITRMLKCLMVLGAEDYAKQILEWLKDMAVRTDISNESLSFWISAVYE